MYLSEMRKTFNDAITLIIDDKRDKNKSFMNNEEYDCRMEDNYLNLKRNASETIEIFVSTTLF